VAGRAQSRTGFEVGGAVLEVVAVVSQHGQHGLLVAQHASCHVQQRPPQHAALARRARPLRGRFPKRGFGAAARRKHHRGRVLSRRLPHQGAASPEAVGDELERAAGLRHGDQAHLEVAAQRRAGKPQGEAVGGQRREHQRLVVAGRCRTGKKKGQKQPRGWKRRKRREKGECRDANTAFPGCPRIALVYMYMQSKVVRHHY
jgi:hypothetical protein